MLSVGGPGRAGVDAAAKEVISALQDDVMDMRDRLTKIGAVIALAGLALTGPALELDLAGEWTLSGSNEVGAAISCPIAVPGDVHSALFKAKLMSDPFFGTNETNCQWVGRRTWRIFRSFRVGPEILSKKAVVLRVEDADSFCTLLVNGRRVGETSSRFRRWEFDLKPYLREGENEIAGVFVSSADVAEARAKEYGLEYRMSNVTATRAQAHIRKPACHAGWDWGLAQMVTGFCGPLTIIAYDDCKVDYVYSTQEFNADLSHCDLTVFAEATDADGRSFTVTNRFPIDNPPLWWPNGAGERKFQTCTFAVGSQTVTKRFGLRKVEVLHEFDRTEKGEPGRRLAFRVNGRELFMKGANWIPCSAFDAEQTPARYRDLLESAAAANMNMIRLWGGGQFEKDAFYDLCDELGLLVWHDLMFACAVYPSDGRFFDEVRSELSHQLRRLRDHASIAMWCGDNECISALNWGSAGRKIPAFKDDLVKRIDVEAEAVRAFDPTRLFWPSSPSSGPGDYWDWSDGAKGDVHNWSVWHEGKQFEAFCETRPRFCSEFGFQSYSSPEVARTFSASRPLDVRAPDFLYHQKNHRGNEIINKTFDWYFKAPKDAGSVLYLSQVQQALAIKTGVEFWRSLRPWCMGTLYWQLNDNWPVASWSSVEYGGKWKHLHYQARRFYEPLAVVGLPNDEIAVLNDLSQTVAADVSVEEWRFDGVRPERVFRVGRELRPDSVLKLGPKDFGADGFGGTNEFRVLTLKTARGTFRNDRMLRPYGACPLADAKVTVRFDGLTVTLKTDRPAFYVWANVEDVRGEFSDNSFTLLPNEPRTLEFRPKEPLSPAAFRSRFSVRHLRESY